MLPSHLFEAYSAAHEFTGQNRNPAVDGGAFRLDDHLSLKPMIALANWLAQVGDEFFPHRVMPMRQEAVHARVAPTLERLL